MARRLVYFFWLLIAGVMLRSIVTEVRTWSSVVADSDFWGYYTAASLVRQHNSTAIYEEADRNVDPVEEKAAPDTRFAQEAETFGIRPVGLYDYPPVLADLLVPITYLPPKPALLFWELINLAALIFCGVLLAGLLEIRTVAGSALVCGLLLLFRPTLDALYYGQAPIVLLTLVLAGMHLHARGAKQTAGFMFALAAAIKLTPLLLIVPVIAWRDWKTLRGFAWALAGIFAAALLINGWQSLDLYFLHELPRMSSKFVDPDNRSLENALQVFRSGLGQHIPAAWLTQVGRVCGSLLLAGAVWMVYSRTRPPGKSPQSTETLAVFALFCCALAPVAWLHAYVLSAPALGSAARRLWKGQSGVLEAVMLVLILLAFGTEGYVRLALMAPVFALALGFVELQVDPARKDLKALGALGAESNS